MTRIRRQHTRTAVIIVALLVTALPLLLLNARNEPSTPATVALPRIERDPVSLPAGPRVTASAAMSTLAGVGGLTDDEASTPVEPTTTPAPSSRPDRTPRPSPTELSALVPTPPPAPTMPTPTPTPPTPRLVIQSIGVDAQVVTLGTDANNTMETPSDPFSVAWYDFTAAPGSGSNAVFAGHIDHYRVGRSVFWDLPDVKIGDVIEYRALDGATVRYRITRTLTLKADAPANDVVSPTATEMITLITCVGNFDRSSRSYDQRLIVQGERISG